MTPERIFIGEWTLPSVDAFRFLMSAVYAGALAPEHRADLGKSGLTEETISMHGFRSVPPSMLGQLLGWDSSRIRSAMLLPHPDPFAAIAKVRGWVSPEWMDHVYLKLFPPFKPRDKDGNETRGTIKYGQPKGTPPRLYFPWPSMVDVVTDQAPLWLVEGSKKALAAAQLGFAAVGFSGVQAWHVKGFRELLADFDLIPLEGRLVEIVPDADVETNPDVARGIERLSVALAARGARPRIVLLPADLPADAMEAEVLR